MQAIQAVGSLVQGVGAYQAGIYNKRRNFAQAREEEMAGEAEASRIRDEARRAMGEQVAAQFANGMMGGTGSALDALAESRINAALDVMQVRRDAASKAKAYRAAGKQAKVQGTFGLISGALGAGAGAYQQGEDWAQARRGVRTSGGGSSGGDIVVTRGGPLPRGY